MSKLGTNKIKASEAIAQGNFAAAAEHFGLCLKVCGERFRDVLCCPILGYIGLNTSTLGLHKKDAYQTKVNLVLSGFDAAVWGLPVCCTLNRATSKEHFRSEHCHSTHVQSDARLAYEFPPTHGLN